MTSNKSGSKSCQDRFAGGFHSNRYVWRKWRRVRLEEMEEPPKKWRNGLSNRAMEETSGKDGQIGGELARKLVALGPNVADET